MTPNPDLRLTRGLMRRQARRPVILATGLFSVAGLLTAGAVALPAAPADAAPITPSATTLAAAPAALTAPGAPTNVAATAGDEQATVTFTAPASDGGLPISGYAVTVTDTTNPASGGQTVTGTGSPLTVTGLTNGDSYTFTVTALNAFGLSPASAPSNAVTPSGPAGTIPGAPANVTATAGAGAGQATVTFTAPASDGGAPITGYTVTATDTGNPADGQTATGADSPITVTGLTNGDSYTFTVTAVNAIGTGPASPPSNPVTPTGALSAPGAPTNVAATAGDEQATVTFTAPASDGGLPISGYAVTVTDTTNPASGGQTVTGTGSPLTVTGLTNGDSYTFTVTALNAFGLSPASAPSNAVTPTAPVTTTAPGAPTIGTATAGDGQATVTFTAPASDGGSPVTGYTVTATDTTNPANGGQTATSTGSPLTVTGLANGDSYTFTVTAANAVGTGPASVPSNTVIPTAPATVPGVPTDVVATAGDSQATVTFTAPVSDGGSPITQYEILANDITDPADSVAATATGSPTIVTGLDNGDTYDFIITASNAVGTGPASVPSNTVIPTAPVTTTAPGAPTTVNATAGDGQATVTFTAPASDGGSPITGYTVLATDTTNPANGGQTATGTGSPLTVTGLSNGDSYTFTVTAANAIGTSPASAGSNPVTPTAPVTTTVPGAPTDVNATAGNGQATVTFRAPTSDGGSPITRYTVTATDLTHRNHGGQTATGTGSPITIPGLTDGDRYTFTVTATNAIGTSHASTPSNAVTPEPPARPTADLSVAISQHPPVRDGETFTERVTVTDHGPSRATGIDTVIAVPAQFVIVSDQGGRKSGQDVTWDGASLGAGQSVTYTVTIRVSGRASGVAILTATTSSAQVTDPDRRNNTAITAIRLG